MAATAQQQTASGLRRDAIGLREVLFQSITDMAPGAAIAASIPAGVAFAGGALPLAVGFALVSCLLCALCIGLGLFEIGVCLVLAVFLVVHAGRHNTWSVFGTTYTPGGFRGITGVIGGSVFTLLAFGGFEGAAPLAEETRNPRRTIQRAVLLATLLIGALYVFTTYAVDVAFGPKGFASFATPTGNSSRDGPARSLYGLF